MRYEPPGSGPDGAVTQGFRMPHKPTRQEIALVALSWAMLAFALLVAFRNWPGTPR